MSFNFTRFYETAVAEPATQVEDSGNSLASILAKSGTKTDANQLSQQTQKVDKPIIEPTKSESEKKDNETKADVKPEKAVEATATQTNVEKKVELETPQKQEEAKVETPKPQKEEVPQPKLSLQEVLKQQPETEVLKALGFGDDEMEILNELKNYENKKYFSQFLKALKEGKGTEYMKEWNTDYAKMPAENVMKHLIRQQYPKASDKAIDALYKKEVIEKYNLDSLDDEQKEEGMLLLEAVADKHRDEFVTNQKTYLTPKPSEQKSVAQPDNSEALRKQQEFEVFQSSINNDPYTKDIETTGKLTLGEGDDKFKFTVEPATLKKILYDPDLWAEKLFKATTKADGSKIYEPDVKKQMVVAAYLQYGDDFLKEYANHYKSLGGSQITDKLENAKPKEVDKSSKSVVQPDTPAAVLAKGGKMTSGGYQ